LNVEIEDANQWDAFAMKIVSNGIMIGRVPADLTNFIGAGMRPGNIYSCKAIFWETWFIMA
jgi:hypothetical protein